MVRTSPPARPPWVAGHAVRRDWPDRTHEFVCFTGSLSDAVRFAQADEAYWRRGPWRPAHTVVVISGRDFDLHRCRPSCRAPDCPAVPAEVATPRSIGRRGRPD